MPGVTKRIFQSEIRDIFSMWNNEIKQISKTLPKNYTHDDIILSLKYYFPHEWNSFEYKYVYYSEKDKYIKRNKGKNRYNMLPPEKLIKNATQYKYVMSNKNRDEYCRNFSDETCTKEKEILWSKRKSKISKVNKKIELAKLKVQQVTPSYIEQVIGIYERKRTSQKDKLYILAELKKYYSPEIIQFFFKLNDTELNKQLRMEAFYHLQSFNYQPRLRKQKYMHIHTKNKKRKDYLKNVYPNERSSIEQTPTELVYRINNSKEQKLKRYDYFISHSYRDGSYVQKLIRFENSLGHDVFCDWINDSNYLKRSLLCEATLSVIETRLEQSEALIFVESGYSRESIWCKYELNYFLGLGKPIYLIPLQDIESERFEIALLKDDWFVDKDYKKLINLNNN